MSGVTAQRPVDLAHLARYTGGEPRLNAEVLDLFLDQSVLLLQRLATLIDPPNSRAWLETAHALKGAAMGVGAFPLAEAAALAETIDPAAGPEPAAEALLKLELRSSIVKTFVGAYLGR